VTEKNFDSFFADFDSLTNELRSESTEVVDFAYLCCDPYTIDSSQEVCLRMANTDESKTL
jgi:hypothetical protein